jgi:hypothetical protein
MTHHTPCGIGFRCICVWVDGHILGLMEGQYGEAHGMTCDLLERLRMILPRLRRFLSSTMLAAVVFEGRAAQEDEHKEWQAGARVRATVWQDRAEQPELSWCAQTRCCTVVVLRWGRSNQK